MGDSDDEFNRRRRDKFRRERDDFDRRDDRGRERGQFEERGRMSWDKRDRRDFREFDRRRERYSPNGRDDISPPVKRFRGADWENRGGNYGHHEGGYGGGHQQGNWGNQGDIGPPHGNYGNQNRTQEADFPTQPPMMSFKQFLSSQDDNITDEEAIKKYNEYKVDFKKQQMNEFFLAHKDEEWFKTKYFPEDYDKRQEQLKQSLKQRCSVFSKLLELGRVERVSVDTEKTEEIVKLLDAAVILMEGGTEFDLQILDMVPKPEVEPERTRQNSENPAQSEVQKEDKEEGEEKESEGEEEEDDKKSEAAAEEMEQDEIKEDKDDKESPKKKEKKKKRDYSYESGSESDSGSSSDSEGEIDADTTPTPIAAEPVASAEVEEEPVPPGMETNDKDAKNEKNDLEVSENQENGKEGEVASSEDKEKDTQEEGEHKDNPKPQAFHTTHSIFLRNLAPTITKQEVEAMCKRFPGYLRVALQDPQPERRFFRRGWVTFDRTVNIKEICWNLNNIRLRDCEMGAIVNRELKQRVRQISGITAHKSITKQDIKHAAKVVQNFDNRWAIWANEEEKKDEEKEPPLFMGLISNNPVLKNITDYLVDEGSYEEEAYFGECVDDKAKDGNSDVSIERDDELCKVLDRMILYLRIVHSYDYYSGVEYPNEDEMPHRCGILHARGAIPPSKVTDHDLTEWNQQYEGRILPFLSYRWQLENDEAIRFGKKDNDAEVEKFVTANTQELAKDKWLCPLSGKKFKGPEFVRKHLFNKHAKEVDDVKQEVTYFNNYLLDPKRPQLPEHAASRQGGPGPPAYRQESGGHGGTGGSYNQPSGGSGGAYQGGGYRGNMGGGSGGYSRPPMYNNYQGRGRGQRRGYHTSNYHSRGGGGHEYRQDYRRDRGGGGGGGGAFFRRDRGRQDPRGIIEYRDLDAPDDNDIF